MKVDTHRRSRPLLSYLAKAFWRRGNSYDKREEVSAARFDLFLLAISGLAIFFFGAGFEKLVKW